ncbi:MAG: hypothetical protein HOW73_45900 [Polyangiaceae bacterium]|nr:hypothetical protein [Polyangiaceae bacterium]
MDWKKLQHAQGPATRIPQQIETLGDASRAGDDAYFHLTEALVAPGQWFPADAPAAELLANRIRDRAPGLVRALRLLGDMAAGDHLWLVAPAAEEQRKQSSAAAKTFEHASSVASVAEEFLGDEQAALRSAAIFFLALVGGTAVAKKKVADLAEKDPSRPVRAGAAVALGFFSRGGDSDARARLEALPTEGLPGSGRWAGKAIAGLDCTDDEAASGAAGWFTSIDTTLVPWGRGDAGRWVTALLAHSEQRDVVPPAIVRAFAAQGEEDHKRRKAIGELALDLAGFKSQFDQMEVAPPERLSDAQRKTARSLAEMQDIVPGLRWGMPGSSRCIDKWLGLAPPSPLELEVAPGERRWQRTRARISDETSAGVVIDEAMSALTPVERLDVAQELLIGAYKILVQTDGDIPPEAFEQMIEAAGAAGVTWAKSFLVFAAEASRRNDNLFMLTDAHLLAAFKVLLRQGIVVEPEWDDAVGFEPPEDARLVLEAIPEERRSEMILRRLRLLPDLGKGAFIAVLPPVLDLVGSPELIEYLRKLLENPKISEIAGPEIEDQLRAPT